MVPNLNIYNALINACVFGNQLHLEQALQVFKAMQQQALVPDVSTYNMLISGCKMQHEHAVEVFDAKMQRQRVKRHREQMKRQRLQGNARGPEGRARLAGSARAKRIRAPASARTPRAATRQKNDAAQNASGVW